METKLLQTIRSCYRQILLLFIGSLLFFQGWSQGNIRIQLPDTDVPVVSDMKNGQIKLTFSHSGINQLLGYYTITGFGKEFPMFQEEADLKDIYYISYSGAGNLYEDLKNVNYFPLVEDIGIGEVLSIPTDYTTPHLTYERIHVPGAWSLTESTPGVKLGMIDLPVSNPNARLIPDLDPAMEFGTQSGYVSWNAHSVGVGATMAAAANNGPGITFGISAGIGFNSRLYAGSGMVTLNIQDQIARGARAINISMATRVNSGSAIEQLFYNKVAAQKIIVVAASGNGQIGFGGHIMNNGSTEYCLGTNVQAILCHPDYTGNSNGYVFPAAYENVLSVSGLDIVDNLYGDFSYSAANRFDCDADGIAETPLAGTLTLNDKVDVLAPPSILAQNGHGTTSYAAPVITGAIGLMLSVNPNLDIHEVIDIFNRTGVNVSDIGINPLGPGNNNSDYFQNGNTADIYKLKDQVRRIDVEAAVAEAKNRYEAWLITQAAQPSQLERVNTGVHVNEGVSSFSLNWIDYDNDNDLDIYNGTNLSAAGSPASEFKLFNNRCFPAGEFSVLHLPGFETNNSMISKIGWGDFDNDKDKDFVGYNEANELIFYENKGETFVSAPIAVMTGGISMHAGSVADFNTDGNLDFIVGPDEASVSPNYVYVYRGNGDGTFTLIGGNSSSIYTDGLSFYASATGDVNGDGNQDVALAGASGNELLNLYYGDGNFGFTKINMDPARVNYVGHGVSLVDYDNDTDLDLYFNCSPHGVLFNNLNNGKFFYTDNVVLTEDAALAGSNASWGDYDNDGDQDVYVPGAHSKTLYNNEKGIIFSRAVHEAASQASEANHETANAAFGDGDNDGDLDLYVSNVFSGDLNNYYYVNRGNSNNWIKLKLTGANTDFLGNGRKTSVSAEGTEITAMMATYTSTAGTAGLTQTRYVHTNDGSPHDIHLGLGTFTLQVSIRIKWPSGLTEVFVLQPNTCYKITEGTRTFDSDCGCLDMSLLPDAAFESHRSCDALGTSYDFEYTGSTPDASYLWNFGPYATPSTSTAQNPDHIEFSVAETQLVSLTVTRNGFQKIVMEELHVSSPVGCNGSPKKIMLCKNGNEVCVPISAAASMIANAGYCVGECDKNPNKNKSSVPVSDQPGLENISLFPNPGNGSFQVVHSDGDLPVSVTVMNSLGELILFKSVDQPAYHVDLTQEANGVYFLIIKTAKTSYYYRAVKQ